jgi:hypothetical protein
MTSELYKTSNYRGFPSQPHHRSFQSKTAGFRVGRGSNRPMCTLSGSLFWWFGNPGLPCRDVSRQSTVLIRPVNICQALFDAVVPRKPRVATCLIIFAHIKRSFSQKNAASRRLNIRLVCQHLPREKNNKPTGDLRSSGSWRSKTTTSRVVPLDMPEARTLKQPLVRKTCKLKRTINLWTIFSVYVYIYMYIYILYNYNIYIYHIYIYIICTYYIIYIQLYT